MLNQYVIEQWEQSLEYQTKQKERDLLTVFPLGWKNKHMFHTYIYSGGGIINIRIESIFTE